MSAPRRCELVVLDAEQRPRVCDAPGTTTRTIDGVLFDACAPCAAYLDKNPPAPIVASIMAARGHDRVPGHPRKKRIVVRYAREDLPKLDSLRARCPGTSRAQLIRGLSLYAAPVAEKEVDAALARLANPAAVPRVPTLRVRIVMAMEASPDEVFGPARLSRTIGHANRDSIRNTLLVLAAQGKIDKCGEGQYQARKPDTSPALEGGAT